MGETAAHLPRWITPDRNGALSMQDQIARWLRSLITTGGLAPGDRLPSEAVLVGRLGVSRVTLRLAVDDLVARGLLTRSHGRGTFVARPLVRHDLLTQQAFFDALLSNAVEPEARLLSYDQVVPPPDVAALFGLAARDGLPRIERLYMSAGAPVACTTGWLTADAAWLSREQVETRSTATIHAELLKRPVVASTVSIGAELAGAVAARLLAVRLDAPMVILSRSRFDAAGHLRDHSRFTINPALYDLTFRIGTGINKMG